MLKDTPPSLEKDVLILVVDVEDRMLDFVVYDLLRISERRRDDTCNDRWASYVDRPEVGNSTTVSTGCTMESLIVVRSDRFLRVNNAKILLA